MLKRQRENDKRSKDVKEVALLQSLGPVSDTALPDKWYDTVDACYLPYLLDGFVSLPGEGLKPRPVRILRDTGATQSLMLPGILPLADEAESSVLVKGVGRGYISVPLHQVQLSCSLATGIHNVGVSLSLPVKGVDFLLGNDIVGGRDRVVPVVEVLKRPVALLHPDMLSKTFPGVFPVCAVTRAQARKQREEVDLADAV